MNSFINGLASRWSHLIARYPIQVSIVVTMIGTTLSILGAYLLRFDFSIATIQENSILRVLLPAFLIKLIVFWRMDLLGGWWRYASLADALDIFKATLVSSLVLTIFLVLVYRFEGVPRSILVLDAALAFLFFTGLRFVDRLYRERYLPGMGENRIGTKTIIVGAGEGGQTVVREIRKNAQLKIQLLGFVDDDPLKKRARFQGYGVLGTIDDLESLVSTMEVEQIVVAIPGATSREMRRIVDVSAPLDVRIRTLPGISDLIDGRVSVQQIRDIDVRDLLGRRTIDLDVAQLSKMLKDQRILVTGAAGSIGSELCRQISKFEPAQLVMFDVAESPLFFVNNEVEMLLENTRAVVGDVCDEGLLRSVFSQYRPHIVFHAAAYKHVSMMETNPFSAVNVNIRGTKILADTAVEFDVGTFVMISTDKAVHPTNMMGVSKRCAEIYVQNLNDKSRTHFVTVRFGNVLDSVGSVIPIFRKQIEKGGPVTVTDAEATRYFMTIPEASQLVMQAGCMGEGGEIFLLDMGDPVKILFLAEELIRLSGLVPHDDIKIVYTGLRPGEKLHEELLMDEEAVKPTSHPSISVATAQTGKFESIDQLLEELISIRPEQPKAMLIEKFQAVVPEFVLDNALSRPGQSSAKILSIPASLKH